MSRLSITFIAYVAAACFSAASLSFAQSQPIPSTFFGMHIARTPASKWPDAPVGALGKKSGTSWRWLEPTPGEYRWKGLDTWVNAAEQHGVPVMYTFGQPPEWASNVGPGCGKRHKAKEAEAAECPESPNIQAWNRYVTAVVTRYKGRIEFYELWNEPNNPHHWSGSYRDMVTLAKEASAIVHSIDPQAMVLTPATAAGREGGPQPRRAATSLEQSTWLDEYFENGGGSYADAITFHAYPRYDSCSDALACAGSSLLAQIDRIRAVMVRHGLSDKPLYVTEGGWRTEGDLPDLNQQVAFVGRWFLILASRNVAAAYWYAWDTWGTLWDAQHGLHPAGQAFIQVHNWLLGAVVSPCTLNKNVWTCALQRPEYSGMAIWSNSAALTYLPPGQYKQYRDLLGRVSRIKGPVQVGPSPILLETSSPAP